MKRYKAVTWEDLKKDIKELSEIFPPTHKIGVRDVPIILELAELKHPYDGYIFVTFMCIREAGMFYFKIEWNAETVISTLNGNSPKVIDLFAKGGSDYTAKLAA